MCWKNRITNNEILRKVGAGRGVGQGEEETGGVEGKTRKDGQ